MKKIKILTVLIITFLMTGCAKLNATMKINKDKSMDYEVIIAFDSSMASQSNLTFDENSLKEVKNNEYKIEEYKDDSMTGYRFTRHIKNIDSISTSKKIKGSIDVNNSEKNIFTVKKGFFKNTYSANLTTNSTDLSKLPIDNSSDYSALIKNMDLKFEIQLPYKAKSSPNRYSTIRC